MNYSDALKDPRWQKRRLQILERDGWACQRCLAEHLTLHVHHRVYARGAQPWEYPDEDLVTLCEGCHERVTNSLSQIQEIVGRLSFEEIEIVLGYVAALSLETTGGFIEVDGEMSRIFGALNRMGKPQECSFPLPDRFEVSGR